MSYEQEAMKLVAEVVDKFSGPLKDLVKRLKETGDASEKAHGLGSKAAREHSKHLRELHERIAGVRDVTTNLMTPAFAAVGLSIAGVAESIKSAIDSARRFGDVGFQFEMTGRRAGIAATHVRRLEEMALRLGMSAESMGGGLE